MCCCWSCFLFRCGFLFGSGFARPGLFVDTFCFRLGFVSARVFDRHGFVSARVVVRLRVFVRLGFVSAHVLSTNYSQPAYTCKSMPIHLFNRRIMRSRDELACDKYYITHHHFGIRLELPEISLRSSMPPVGPRHSHSQAMAEVLQNNRRG